MARLDTAVTLIGTRVTAGAPAEQWNGHEMPRTAKKIVITALATGGIVAGVATASAAPLRTSSPVAATSAEEARLHTLVVGLTDKEQALQATLRAKHHAPPTTVVAPGATAVQGEGASQVATGSSSWESTTAPSTAPAGSGGDHTVLTEPTTEPEPTTTTTTTGPTTTTTGPTTTTTYPDDNGGHGTND